MIQPAIQTIEAKQLVGIRRTMSLNSFPVSVLWKSFLQQRFHWAQCQEGAFLFSVTQYPPDYFACFDAQNTFDKWAAVEVTPNCQLPEGLETFVLPVGVYAVFNHRGLSTDHRIFQYIFTQWLPTSSYIVDHRPHFEILSPQYQPNDPQAAETICIPVQFRG